MTHHHADYAANVTHEGGGFCPDLFYGADCPHVSDPVLPDPTGLGLRGPVMVVVYDHDREREVVLTGPLDLDDGALTTVVAIGADWAERFPRDIVVVSEVWG